MRYGSREAAMTRNGVLLVLTFLGSAVCWWPAIIEPGLDFPWWILFVTVGLIAGFSTWLCGAQTWPGFVAAAAGGSFAGLLSGFALWPLLDGIAQSYAGIAIVLGTVAAGLAAVICGLASSFAARSWPFTNGAARRVLWVVLGLCLAVGPTLMAITKPLVNRRMARYESIAAMRFASLKQALQQTKAESGGTGNVCDRQSVQKHYSGLPFTLDGWSRIYGNYVEEDHYVYAITCHEEGRYLLEARPKMPRGYGYGERLFCADES
jgi:hypothetical protein